MLEFMLQKNKNFYLQKKVFIFLFILFLVNCGKDLDIKENCITGPEEKDCVKLKYEGIDESYSFLKDTSWLDFESYEEKLFACQIPDSILTHMCTYNLVKTCLVNYPFLLDLTALNNIQYGFDKFKGAFNGIQELIKRCDGCLEIIDYYKESILFINPDSSFSFKSSWGIYYTEIFLAQPVFFDNLSKDDKLELFHLALNVKLLKLNDERHGLASIAPTDWIVSRIMLSEGYAPFIKTVEVNQNLNHFIETMFPLEINGFFEVDSLIDFYSKNFIN